MISPLTILFAWLGIFFIGMTFGLGFWFAGTVFKKRTYSPNCGAKMEEK